MSALGWGIGLGLALVGGGVALAVSSSKSTATPGAQTPTTPFTFTAGHRYSIQLSNPTGSSMPTVTLAQIQAALPNVVQQPPPPAPMPVTGAANVIDVHQSGNSVFLTLDVFTMSGTETAGTLAAIVTGNPNSLALAGGGSVMVVVTDQGVTQPPYAPAPVGGTAGCVLPAGGVSAVLGDQLSASVPIYGSLQVSTDPGALTAGTQVTGYTSSDTTGTILAAMPGCPATSGLFQSGSAGTAQISATIIDASGNPQPSLTLNVIVGGS